MNKQKLLQFVGEKVEVTFFDEDVKVGTLGQGKGVGLGYYNSDERWFYLKEHRLNFRPSHVKSIKRIENDTKQ